MPPHVWPSSPLHEIAHTSPYLRRRTKDVQLRPCAPWGGVWGHGVIYTITAIFTAMRRLAVWHARMGCGRYTPAKAMATIAVAQMSTTQYTVSGHGLVDNCPEMSRRQVTEIRMSGHGLEGDSYLHHMRRAGRSGHGLEGDCYPRHRPEEEMHGTVGVHRIHWSACRSAVLIKRRGPPFALIDSNKFYV